VQVLLQQTELGDPGVFLDQLENLRLDVLIIDLTRLSEPFEQIVRRIKAGAVTPMIIALNETAGPEVILGAYAPARTSSCTAAAGGAAQALERLSGERAQKHASSHQRGKTLGFLSVKGGCGATTIACHVGWRSAHDFAGRPAGRSGLRQRDGGLSHEGPDTLLVHGRGAQRPAAGLELLKALFPTARRTWK